MKNLIFALTAILFALGCASVTPAPSAPSATTDGLDRAIREASDYLNANVPAGSKIVILNVQSSSDALSDYVIDELMANAVNDRKFELVDRHQLDLIRAEQNFQMSGAVDDREALEIGKFFGAQTIVSGAVTPLGERYRMTIRALEVQSAKVQGHYNRNLEASPTLTVLMKMRGRGTPAQPSGVRLASASGGVAGGGAGGNVSAGAVVSDGSVVVDGGSVDASVTSGNVAVTQANPTQTQTTYRIGGTGQAGGLIFYDKGNNIGGWRYMEAAPTDNSVQINFANNKAGLPHEYTNLLPNEQIYLVGRGKENTAIIMEWLKKEQGGGFKWAVRICDDLVINGFDDWFLPSRDELSYMYGNLHIKELGNFKNAQYWTSSVYHSTWWYTQMINFTDGKTAEYGSNFESYNTDKAYVRAARRF